MNKVALSFSCCSFQIYKVNTHKITSSGNVRDANIVEYGVKKKARHSYLGRILSSRECTRLVGYVGVELSTLSFEAP
jgi:hypothetical protein